MQKVITVTIDLERLQSTGQQDHSRSTSFVNELPEINQLLEEGWMIEEWEILNVNSVNSPITLLFILTDELMYDTSENATDSAFQLEEEQEED